MRPADRPTQTVKVQELSRRKLRTVNLEATRPPGGGTRRPNAARLHPSREHKRSDGCSTDPEPDMETRQAHFRNMRSKCRCSCVLQFTRHHGVSSVLHRPPSQMIHCIVLCRVNFRNRVRTQSQRDSENLGYSCTSLRGEITKPGLRRELFEPY